MLKKNLITIFTLFLLISSCSFFSPREKSRAIANVEVEKIAEEFRSYYQESLSIERRNEIRLLLGNVLKYFVEASSLDNHYKIQMYNEANNYFNKTYPLILKNIQNEKMKIKEFVKIPQAPLWTLKEELKFLNQAVAEMPAPRIEIDLIKGLSLLFPLSLKDGIRNAKSIMPMELTSNAYFLEIEKIMSEQGEREDKVLSIMNLTELKLKSVENKIRNIGNEIAKDIAKEKLVDMSQAHVRVVFAFMDYYFHKISGDVVKTIMSELITSNAFATKEEMLKILFQNTGPGLGKVLQQMGREEGVGETFAKYMSLLESNGKEVPYHLVMEIVQKDHGGYEIITVAKKPLGTGTMAQVNKASLWLDNREINIALRFLKPGIKKRVAEDVLILKQFIPDNQEMLRKEGFVEIEIFSSLVKSVENFLLDEADLKIAINHQKKASEVYNQAIKIKKNPAFQMLEVHVPEVFMPPNKNSNLHVQEFASGGIKFEELSEISTKKIVAQEMVRVWFEEALFKSGFFNADLHQGNFRVTLIEEEKKIKIVLYDFGLSSTLEKEDQRSFLMLGAGASLRSPEILAEGMLISMGKQDESLSKKLLKDIEIEMKRSPLKSPEEWIVWSVQKKYFTSDKLGAFARGSALIKQLPESVGETEMLKDTLLRSSLERLKSKMADRTYDYPLQKKDLFKLGKQHIKNTCLELFKTLFSKSLRGN